MKVYKLVAPETDVSKLIGYNIGIRPARKGGPRLERENIKDKIVYHNYGHAGYGVTMAYGSALLMVSRCAAEVGPTAKDIAIIGCGYMGLHTALLLKELNYNVTIYAETLPSKFGLFNDEKDKLTSQIAAGLISPFHFDYSPNRPLTHMLCQTTFQYLERMHNLNKYKGILKRDMYFIQPPREVEESIIKGTMTPFEAVKVDFGKGKLVNAYLTKTYQCQGDVLLNEMLEEAKAAGVKIVKRKLDSLDAVLQLKEKVVFNCAGYGSKYLFDDQSMVPLKGVMISMKKPEGYDYFLEAFMNKKAYAFSVYPMHERISYGIIKVEEEELGGYKNEEKYFNILYENIKEFKERFVDPDPKL